ncbi:MAG: macrolide ABC transporter ATP-binding protein [Deltaproteobacteria bacterium RBG_16_71_12]|nr:MAG: macrolide ABC transporter ATP-binding protein [Deltaproteobacteria bacterium RBG_16_71_12]
MPAVEVIEVKRHYQAGAATVRALDGVSLTVERGEFMAIAGPSGSGKTTLLNLIGALDSPSAGVIRIDGADLAGLSRKRLADLRRDKVGFVFQAYNLIPVLTASENAEYVLELKQVPRAERRKRIGQLFTELGIGELLDTWPGKMSGGQQQRVAVARAIASMPAVVLADEPTANLDQVTGEALIDLMHRLNHEHGVTFIFSTHDPMVLAQAERVVRLVDGKIASDERRGETAAGAVEARIT